MTITEWWYESSLLDIDQILVFARLRVRDGGGVDILTDAGELLPFRNEDEAATWLGDEEYYPFDHLLERLQQEKTPVDPRVKAPAGQSDEEVLRQMVVRLRDAVQAVPPQSASPAALAKSPVS